MSDGNKMSRPTPETDIAEYYIRGEGNFVRSDICRKLERERDEAFELLASEKITRNHIIKRSVEVEKERDEARAARNECERQFQEKVCEIAQLLSERDEALMDRANGDIATMTRNHYERLLRERNEAREALNEIWELADPIIDADTCNRWSKAAGLEEAK